MVVVWDPLQAHRSKVVKAYSGSRSNCSQGEEKGDWLAALDEQSAPRIPLAGCVPVPFFRPQHECDPL
jgi:hypothetical protein